MSAICAKQQYPRLRPYSIVRAYTPDNLSGTTHTHTHTLQPRAYACTHVVCFHQYCSICAANHSATQCCRLSTTLLTRALERRRPIFKLGMLSVCKSALDWRCIELLFQASFLDSTVEREGEIEDLVERKGATREGGAGYIMEDVGPRSWSLRSLVVDLTPLNFWARQFIASSKCTSHFRSIMSSASTRGCFLQQHLRAPGGFRVRIGIAKWFKRCTIQRSLMMVSPSLCSELDRWIGCFYMASEGVRSKRNVYW